MASEQAHVADNETSRERLRALVERLSDEELSRPMPGGWTIAGLLAHIAYWDARAVYWLDRWARGAEPEPHQAENVEAVNDSTKPICLALPPRDAVQLTLRLAEEADAKVAAMGAELLAKIRALGQPPFLLSRAHHREEHLDEIEHMLGQSGPSAST